jgi:sugar lactone lactonase YvrE/uncharacterized protein YqcC (DUF446 family)
MKTRNLPPRVQTVVMAVVAAAMIWGVEAWAIPATLQYQGYLSDVGGAPVTGVLRVVFRLYEDADAAVAPTALWEEVHDSVTVTAGKFTAILGAASPFEAAGVSFDRALFLELEISLEKLQPRLPLHSVPYALKATGVVAGGITAPMLAEGAVQPGKVHVSLAGQGLAVSPTGALRVASGGITADLLADASVSDRQVSPTAAIAPAKIAGTAVTLADGQTLTNKTLDADSNHLFNLDLSEFRPGVILADLAAPAKSEVGTDDHLASAAAIIQFVGDSLARQDSLGELGDTALTDVTAGDILVADGAGQWVNQTLRGDLAMDPYGNATIQPDAVNLGTDTTGLYVATLSAGPGLIGGGSAEGLAATLAVNVDGVTLQIAEDVLQVGLIGSGNIAADAIGMGHLQNGAVSNAKLQNASLTVNPGVGLAGGGSVALGEAVTLSVAPDGIGAAQLAAGIDASGKGFNAAAVDGAGLDDQADAAANVLWSSLRTKDYVDALALGLDWQDGVASIVTAAPTALPPGTRVIAHHVPGWTDSSIYQYNGTVWLEVVPHEGWATWVMDEDLNYVFNGTEWVSISSTQNHEALNGLLGGAENKHYHLDASLYGALTGLASNRLLAADEVGLPIETNLTAWLRGSADQVTVTADGNGGAVLSLPQDLSPASRPQFAGLELARLSLGGEVVTAIGTDPTLAGNRTEALPTEHVVKTYVDQALAAKETPLAELTDVALAGLTPGDLLQFDGSAWVNIDRVPGASIELKAGGGITHGSGLMLDLADDGTLEIAADGLRVGVIGGGNLAADAVALGSKTTGDYVARITAGNGLSGDGVGEGSAPTLAVNVDGTTLVITGDVLRVGSIGGNQLQDGSLGNSKLANPGLTVAAGVGLTGGGLAALGGSTTLSVANGGIGAGQLAANIDVAAKGFRAATAADADRAALADTVVAAGLAEGAGLDDGAGAAGNVLWSSQRIKEYVDGLVMGLDWQNSVVSFVSVVPSAPTPGLRVIAAADFGTWAAGNLYEFNGAAWVGTVSNEGFALWVEGEDRNYVYTGTAWVPMSSTTNHETLNGLLGGAENDHFHLGGRLHDALTNLTGNRLVAADEAGLPAETNLTAWLRGSADQVTVTADGAGGAVLSLPQDLATASRPHFDGLELGSGGLTLGHLEVNAISNDVDLAGDRAAALPTEHAVKTYVDQALADKETLLAELTDVALVGLTPGDLLQFDGAAWANIAKVPGENIEMKDGADAAGNVLWSSQRIKEYVDGQTLGPDWQNSVVAFVTTVPPTSAPGLRVIAAADFGNWTGDDIYEFNGVTWVETVPREGFAVWVESEDRNYTYTGTAWVPMSSTANHESLSGLLGATENDHYHIGGRLYDALANLTGNRLLADVDGLPLETDLTAWLRGSADQVTVSADGHGGAVLSLPQDLAPASRPQFDGLELGSGGLTLGHLEVNAISNDVDLAGDRAAALPTEHAVKTYVDQALAAKEASLAELTDVALVGLATGDLLRFDGTAWVNIAKVPGENIELKDGGAITHGSGLKVNLDDDGSLLITDNALKVGVIGAGNLAADAVALGAKTTGDYVARITAGNGLSGDGTGEGSSPTLAVNVDGTTLVIASDVLSVGSIGGNQVQNGSLGNAKLANPGLTVSAGTGLTGGGLVALGGSTTLGVATGGIGAGQLAANIDVAAKGFRAATAASADWAALADTVVAAGLAVGAGLDDGAEAAGNVLWSSQRIKTYIDALVNGLDWQQSVKFITVVVPPGPTELGTRVIAKGVAGWNNHSIYAYDGVAWVEAVAPSKGFAVCVTDPMRNYVFTGSEWVDFGSTADHQALTGKQGGNPTLGEYYHLGKPLHDALTGLPMKRLIGTDSAGLPAAADLSVWVDKAATGLIVAPRGDGGIILDLDKIVPQGAPTKGNILMGSGTVWESVGQTAITAVGTISAGRWEGSAIAGDRIELYPGGGLATGSGLKINLDSGDESLVIRSGFLTVGQIGTEQVRDESLTGADILNGSLLGQDLAAGTIGILKLTGIPDVGLAGQPVTADGVGGFMLGRRTAMYQTDADRVIRTITTPPPGAPSGVTRDGDGNLYVADSLAHCIRLYSATGEYQGWLGQDGSLLTGFHAVGDGTVPLKSADTNPDPGAFSSPADVAFGNVGGYITGSPKGGTTSTGYLVVADTGNHRIQVISLGTFFAAAFDKANTTGLDLDSPSGVAVAPDGTILIADTGHHRIVLARYVYGFLSVNGWLGLSGGIAGFHTGPGVSESDSGDMMFDSPRRLCLGTVGATPIPVLAVADGGNYRIAMIDVTSFSSPVWLGWIGAGVDDSTGWHGPESTAVPRAGTGPGAFNYPVGVALDRGLLAVSDQAENLLEFYTYDSGAAQWRFASSFGSTGALPGQFSQPTGLALDLDGSFWVCDKGNQRLQKLYTSSYTVVPPEAGNVVIGSDLPEPSAALQIDSTDGGLLVPRFEMDKFAQIKNPTEGLLAYGFGYGTPKSGTSGKGFYFWNGTLWERIGSLGYGEVTSYNLAYEAVTTFQIQNGTIIGEDMADSSIPDSKLQTLTTAGKVAGTAVQLKAGGGLGADAAGLFVGAALPNVIYVGQGQSIVAALNSIVGATETNPYLIKVGPGVFPERLTLKSYVDIEGCGIGKTIITADGGTNFASPGSDATVVASNVTNAGLRHLTIQSVRSDGNGQLVGLYYSGIPSQRGLRLLHVQILLSSSGGSIDRNAWGIYAYTACSGLQLEHTLIEISVTTGLSYGACGIGLRGVVEISDCTLKINNGSACAVGFWIDPSTKAVTVERTTITAFASGASFPDAALGALAFNPGRVTLRQCSIDVGDLYSTAAKAEAGVELRIESCTLGHSLAVASDFTAVRLNAASCTLSHSRVNSPAMAGVTTIAGSGSISKFRAIDCELQGARNTSGFIASYFRCLEVDATGMPIQEVHSALTTTSTKASQAR